MSRINLELQELAAFIEVVERSSFRAAAQELHLSAPALSRRIDKLERTLGVRLLERTTRRVSLTPAGRAFVSPAREALDALERAALGIQEVSRVRRGKVSIACVPSTTITLVPQMLRVFAERLPGVQFRLLDTAEDQVTHNVISGAADFGIGFMGRKTPEIDFTPLRQDSYIVAVPRGHALATRRQLGWDRLRKERLITVSRVSGNRPYVDQVLRGAGELPPVFIEVNRVSTVLSLVQARLGLGLVPRMALPEDHPDIIGIALEGKRVERTIGVMVRHGTTLKPVPQLALELLFDSLGYRAGAGSPPA